MWASVIPMLASQNATNVAKRMRISIWCCAIGNRPTWRRNVLNVRIVQRHLPPDNFWCITSERTPAKNPTSVICAANSSFNPIHWRYISSHMWNHAKRAVFEAGLNQCIDYSVPCAHTWRQALTRCISIWVEVMARPAVNRPLNCVPSIVRNVINSSIPAKRKRFISEPICHSNVIIVCEVFPRKNHCITMHNAIKKWTDRTNARWVN